VKVVIIVQARMTSTRLPGKVLLKVMDKPLLEYQIERLREVRAAEQVLIATTINAADNEIVQLCKRLGVTFFCGSEHDVLDRYYQAAQASHADVIVRITSDCPLIDPVVVDKVIGFYLDHPVYEYVTNCLPRTYPVGMDTEVFSFQALRIAHQEAVTGPDREHVTGYIEQRPDRFCQANVAYKENHSRYRWTVDTPADFELISRIITTLYPGNHNFTLEDCLTLLAHNPEWEKINSHVKQKKYGE